MSVENIQSYLQLMVKYNGSDLFLSAGAPPTLKIDGISKPVTNQELDSATVEKLAFSMLDQEEIARFRQDLEFNKALSLETGGRFRINIFRQRGNPAVVIRYIKTDIPGIAALGMPVVLEKLVMEQRGLVLITGAAGSGKSTTMASMIDYRNQHQSGHILMIEDPIEFIHSHKKSIVDQREIGIDTHSFGNALRNAMREAPDVIAIGEIRDLESLRYALAYAETGHLCLATLHASNAHQTLERILNFYEQQFHPQVLLDLSLHLKAIVCQRLLRGTDDKRVPATEILINTPHVAELIQTGRINDISEAIAQQNQTGSRSFDQSLFQLWKDKRISKEEALTHADSRANLSVLMRLDKGPDSLDKDLARFSSLTIEQKKT
ncbi:MAG TPA: PilT/PilU family type 4a pilus ATPase [Pseudomonadales bacterium]|nr:PilT/PilU family type 4a pilus ATPase [Pseudomonadales bacterium]